MDKGQAAIAWSRRGGKAGGNRGKRQKRWDRRRGMPVGAETKKGTDFGVAVEEGVRDSSSLGGRKSEGGDGDVTA